MDRDQGTRGVYQRSVGRRAADNDGMPLRDGAGVCAYTIPRLEKKSMQEDEWTSKVLQQLLYLCSAQPDMPADYRPAVRTRSPKSLGAPVPTVWDVGAALRGVYARPTAVRAASHTGSNSPKRPHIRRAHWRHYWIGPEHNGELIVKWIPPTLIRAEGELPAVRRRVL